MGVPVRFTPLLGAREDGGPLAHLLEIGPADATLTLLLDCGWGGVTQSADALRPLLDALPRVDAVLLSHAGTRHAGALPMAVGRHGLVAPIYGTAPIAKMGAMFAYDAYLSLQATQDFDDYDLDNVDAAFAAVRKLKYTQAASLDVPRAAALAERLGCGAVRVTPFAAGHTLGACVWKVEVAGEEVVYAVDTNHRKERHLGGCHLEDVCGRPAVLVVDAASSRAQPLDRARRDGALLEPLMAALRAGGSALVPVDTAGRVFELLLLLDEHWGDNNLRDTYPLVMLSTVGPSTLEFAQASLEWMADGVTRAFETGRGNPFRLRNVRQYGSMQELQASPIWRGSRPLVVLASGPDLDPGSLSRQVLLQWARDARSLVLFPQRPRDGSLGAAVAAHAGPAPLQLLGLTVRRRVPLEGDELEAWEEERRRERDRGAEVAAAAAAAAAGAAAGVGGQLALRTSSVGLSQLVKGAGGEVLQLLPGAAAAAPFGPGGGLPVPRVAETMMEGFVPPAGAVAPMFPDEDELLAATWDVYGELIDVEAWRKAAGPAAAAEADDDEEMAAAEEEARPTRVVEESINVSVAPRRMVVDFEGRSDGRGLRTIVGQVAPRQLVVVGAGAVAAEEMTKGWSDDLSRYHARVVAPGPQEAVPLSLATSFPVALHPQLLSGAHVHHLGQYQLTWLDARLAPPAGQQQQQQQQKQQAAGGDQEMADARDQQEDQREEKQQQQQSGEGREAEASEAAAPRAAAAPLQLVPAGAAVLDAVPEGALGAPAAAAAADHGGIFIGDVKLSEVKQALARANIPSAFRAGKLLCAGAVVVSRGAGDEEGVLEIEGPLSEDYYRIRDVVYGQYQVC